MRALSLLFALTLAACSDSKAIPGDRLPDLNAMSEAPGDWSGLDGMIGRTPAESGLFTNSPVITDINATLGPDSARFRHLMGDATPLVRAGPLLVTRARAGGAWLVLQPRDHAFRAGMKRPDGRWQEWQTPGAEVPRPS